MKPTRIILTLAIIFSLTNYSKTQDTVSDIADYASIREFPQPVGWVNDFEHILSISEIETLDSIISNFYQETLNAIAVVTVNSIEPYQEIEDFSAALTNHWGVSRNRNNGLIIVLSKNLDQVWFGTGLRTQKKLPDEVCIDIINEDMKPYFVNNKHYEGLCKGIQACINELNQ